MMNLFFAHFPEINPGDKKEERPLVPMHEHEHNTNEGSEFLDDAIRMHDQPYTGENPANVESECF